MFNAFRCNYFNLVETCNIALILFLKCDVTKFRIPPPLHNVTLCRYLYPLKVWHNYLWLPPNRDINEYETQYMPLPWHSEQATNWNWALPAPWNCLRMCLWCLEVRMHILQTHWCCWGASWTRHILAELALHHMFLQSAQLLIL